jgi:hypothetical protein
LYNITSTIAAPVSHNCATTGAYGEEAEIGVKDHAGDYRNDMSGTKGVKDMAIARESMGLQ